MLSRFNGCACLEHGISLAALIERGSISEIALALRRWKKSISRVNLMIGSAALDMVRKIHHISTIQISLTKALKSEDDYELV
jgi:hypothetical protein